MSAELEVEEATETESSAAVRLTEAEKARLATLGFTEEDVARDPLLRFAGAFADDPDFLPTLQRVFREGRGREMSRCGSALLSSIPMSCPSTCG